MNLYTKLAGVTAALALTAAPAFALPPQAQNNRGTAHAPTSTPSPHAGMPAKARAYGKYCQTESKKHIAGEKGTPFSKCVTAMAKLANGSAKNPRTACKDESKKHIAGEKGTPFSKCVSGGAKLLRDEAADDADEGADDADEG